MATPKSQISVQILLELHAASNALHNAYVSTKEAGDTALAERIAVAGETVAKCIGRLVVGAAESKRRDTEAAGKAS